MAAILVVEDDKHQRLWLQEELQLDGHAVLSAANAAEALAAVQRTMPDLVVLDIGMPGVDGLDLLGRLMDVNNRLPVVIHTAYASYQDNFMSWAADAYVIKQSDLCLLKRTIHDVLGNRRAALADEAAPPEPPTHSARL